MKELTEEQKQKAEEKRAKKEAARNAKKEQYGNVFTDIITTIKEALSGKKHVSDEYIKEFYKYNESNEKAHSIYSKNEKIIFGAICLTILNSLILIIMYIISYCNLRETVLTNNLFYLLPAAVLPYVTWVFSTNENFFAFHQRKRVFFYLCSANLVLVMLQPVYSIIRRITVPNVLLMPVNPALTEKMVLLLAYLIVLALFALTIVVIYAQIEPIITSDTTKRQIELFKLQHIVDNRESRQYKYDVTTIKSLETGKPIRIKEQDRFLQQDIVGASGTGKTSTIFGGVILSDLKQKVINREKRYEEYMQLILSGRATLQGPLKEFREDAIVPLGKTKNEHKKNAKAIATIKKKYRDCGMTIVAPNPSLMEDIIKMCAARDIDVDIVDPVYHYTQYKNVHEVGINPFYVPLDIEESERVIWISKAASVFSEVLIATNQMGGQSDVYFTDISLSVSSNVASVVMLAKNIEGKQAYFDDVADCISNFDNLKDYVDIIQKHYGIKIQGTSTAKPKNGGFETFDSINNAPDPANNSAVKEAAKKNPYYQQILFVQQELLGDGKEAMFSQARGLRNLMTKIVQDPRIKTKLSCQNDDRLDFDRSLAENKITVISTAIELGQSISTSFGLFFLLLLRTSVLRRPKETRTPHFLWIDECSQYVHPFLDDVIALFRQYQCAATLTFQSLLQLEKNPATAFLKGVIMGAGTHIVFGRLGVEEMEMFSAMAGITREMQEQKSKSSNSVLSSNPNYTESVRTTPTLTNNMEGSDLRLLDFLELTIFTIDAGRVLPGQFGRVFFIGQDAFDKQETKEFLWSKAVPEAFRDEANIIDNPMDEEKGKPKAEYSDTIPVAEAEEIVTVKSAPADNLIKEVVKPISLEKPIGDTPAASEPKKTAADDKKTEPEGEDDKAAAEMSIDDFYKQLMGIKD